MLYHMLATGNQVAPAKRDMVFVLRGQGLSKNKIAKRLGMSRNTISALLAKSKVEHSSTWLERADGIVPKALDTIDLAITKGDAPMAMRYLENTLFSPAQRDTAPQMDVTINAISTMLPARPATNGSTGPQLPQSTEAAAKDGGTNIGLSSQTNFSQFSTEQLRAELARREAESTVIDAEVVPEVGDAPAL